MGGWGPSYRSPETLKLGRPQKVIRLPLFPWGRGVNGVRVESLAEPTVGSHGAGPANHKAGGKVCFIAGGKDPQGKSLKR